MSPPRLTTDVIASALATLEPFRALDRRAVEALASSLEARDTPAETVLLREGAPSNEAVLVVRGQVGLYKNLTTRGRVRVAVAGPGGLVGHEGFLDGGPLPYSALTLGRALLLQVDRPAFQALGLGDGALGSCLLEPALRSAGEHALAMRRALAAILRAPEKHIALVRTAPQPGTSPPPSPGRSSGSPSSRPTKGRCSTTRPPTPGRAATP